MWSRKALVLAVYFVLATVLSGCPPGGNSLIGAWRVDFDENCNSSIDRYGGLVLKSDGSAQIVFNHEEYTGVWETNGSTLTVTILSPSSILFTGAASSNGNSISNGAYSGMLQGCWTAQSINYSQP